MKRSLLLTITSLLSILLVTFHLSDDIVRGMSPGGLENLIGVIIMVVWLYGTLILAGRRAGYVIMLLGSLFALAMPVIHMSGSGVGGEFAKSNGSLFFIWTILTLGVTGTFSFILAVRALWGSEE